jgi:hypothetical protein
MKTGHLAVLMAFVWLVAGFAWGLVVGLAW